MNLTHVDALTFTNLTQLQYLNLSHNKLTTIDVSLFRGLVNLRTIDIDYNLLTNMEQGQFDGLINIETLSMSYNPFIYLNTSLVFDLFNLTYLGLSATNLTLPFDATDVPRFLNFLQTNTNRFVKLREVHFEYNLFEYSPDIVILFQLGYVSFKNENLLTTYMTGNSIYDGISNIQILCGSNPKCVIVPDSPQVSTSTGIPANTTSTMCLYTCKHYIFVLSSKSITLSILYKI